MREKGAFAQLEGMIIICAAIIIIVAAKHSADPGPEAIKANCTESNRKK